mmetsp:Transcript_31242/g.93625  ORF Transcript_31242/g.93625 Transcript_31242/m.93625 type:complete len:539 (-) Transcript_31242:689-2305(-)
MAPIRVLVAELPSLLPPFLHGFVRFAPLSASYFSRSAILGESSHRVENVDPVVVEKIEISSVAVRTGRFLARIFSLALLLLLLKRGRRRQPLPQFARAQQGRLEGLPPEFRLVHERCRPAADGSRSCRRGGVALLRIIFLPLVFFLPHRREIVITLVQSAPVGGIGRGGGVVVQELPLDVIPHDDPRCLLVVGHARRRPHYGSCDAIRPQQLLGRGRGQFRPFAPPRRIVVPIGQSPLPQVLLGGYGEGYTVPRVQYLPGYPPADQFDDGPVISHLSDGKHPGGDQVGGPAYERGKYQAGTVAQSDVGPIGQRQRLKVLRLPRLGRDAHPDESVRVLRRADENVDDRGFADVGEPDHTELVLAAVPRRGSDVATFGERDEGVHELRAGKGEVDSEAIIGLKAGIRGRVFVWGRRLFHQPRIFDAVFQLPPLLPRLLVQLLLLAVRREEDVLVPPPLEVFVPRHPLPVCQIVALIHHDQHGLPQIDLGVRPQISVQVKQRISRVDYLNHCVGPLQYPPKLTPHLQILLERCDRRGESSR